jgi:excinuclease UvrABC helicase subunit UvrB
VEEVRLTTRVADAPAEFAEEPAVLMPDELSRMSREEQIRELEKEMLACAARLEFEQAASLRDRIEDLESQAR